MTRDEFIKLVKRFNTDKIKYNWLKALDFNRIFRFKNFKKQFEYFPDYYDFVDANEFKYWLINSDKEEFIEERFCKVCGNFIEKNKKCDQFVPYSNGCCKEHMTQLRMQNVQKSLIEKYGTKCPFEDKEIHEKIIKNNIEKYGVEYPLQNKTIHAKTIEIGKQKNSYKKAAVKVKQTKLKKYGNENYNNVESIKLSKSKQSAERKKEILDKVKQTKLERYGTENYNNNDMAKQTCLKKYGVDNVSKVPEIMAIAAQRALETKEKNHTTMKELMRDENYRKNYIDKVRKTKHENNTLNSSINFEDALIIYLKNKYKEYTIIQSYYDKDRYPYTCDCYIKELDLFIEFQGSYYHNFRPFNNSDMHIKEYEQMIKKGPQMKSIANVWRYRDVEKRECAKKNNLNYLEYWEHLKILPEDINNNDNNLVLYYQQGIFYKINKECLFDPIERWKYYQNAVKYSDFYKKHGYVSHLTLLRRPYISKQIGYSSFNIKLCNIVDKKYSVYDPCGGWGHRLLGFKEHKQYIYNDVNIFALNNCKRLAKDQNINNVKFYYQDAINSINDEYDIVFTCPPYFDKEIFTNKGAENYTEKEFICWWNTVLDNLHPTTGEIYIVINSNYLEYFTANNYKYEIVNEKLRKSHYHKNTKESSEIIVKFTKF